MSAPGNSRSVLRLFARHAAVSLVPVLLLGVVLAVTYRSEAMNRGLAEGKSMARMLARSAVEPLLGDRPVSEGIGPAEEARLYRRALLLTDENLILRLRIRDLDGTVIYSQDGSGLGDAPDHHAIEAANGATIAELTHLNADANDAGGKGVAAVEVYEPINNSVGERIGVLEV